MGYVKGLYLKGKGLNDEAIKVFSDLNKQSQFAWNYYQIAIIENIKGNTSACLKNLETTFELDPTLKSDASSYVELQNLQSNAEFLKMTM